MEGSSLSFPCSHIFWNILESQAYGLDELILLFKTRCISTEVTWADAEEICAIQVHTKKERYRVNRDEYVHVCAHIHMDFKVQLTTL